MSDKQHDPPDSDPPALQHPPEDWPLEKRLASHRKWIEEQGGRLQVSPDAPPEVLGQALAFECPLCAGKPGRKLRELFEPPLEALDPALVRFLDHQGFAHINLQIYTKVYHQDGIRQSRTTLGRFRRSERALYLASSFLPAFKLS